jgi:hypothetical protein
VSLRHLFGRVNLSCRRRIGRAGREFKIVYRTRSGETHKELFFPNAGRGAATDGAGRALS